MIINLGLAAPQLRMLAIGVIKETEHCAAAHQAGGRGGGGIDRGGIQVAALGVIADGIAEIVEDGPTAVGILLDLEMLGGKISLPLFGIGVEGWRVCGGVGNAKA